MNETQLNAQFAALVEQRNAALNTVVNMAGELAVAKAKIAELEGKLNATPIEEVETVGEANA